MNIVETVITPSQYRRLEQVHKLKSYGHKFRIGHQHEGWYLYTEQIGPGRWTSYKFYDDARLYHRWDTQDE